jgi:hypothetical protein
MCIKVSFNYLGACTGRVLLLFEGVGRGGGRGEEVVKQMRVSESLNYSDRCMQKVFFFHGG